MLQGIPAKYFEIAGSINGFAACLVIATQIYAEYTTDKPSTMSTVYVLGFLIIFAIWTVYGLRFKRAAVWLTNGIAVLMQTILLIVISSK